jgi:hypothetical protein
MATTNSNTEFSGCPCSNVSPTADTVSTDTPACTSTVFQSETVCVPVTVKPYAIPGTTKTTCCNKPVVSDGNVCGSGNANFCTFTITQELCIEVPISFGADIETGTAAVQCGTAGTDGCKCSEDSLLNR